MRVCSDEGNGTVAGIRNVDNVESVLIFSRSGLAFIQMKPSGSLGVILSVVQEVGW